METDSAGASISGLCWQRAESVMPSSQEENPKTSLTDSNTDTGLVMLSDTTRDASPKVVQSSFHNDDCRASGVMVAAVNQEKCELR